MTADELAEHIRRLQAERARPEGRHGKPTVEELLQRLIATLHALYKTPPDREGARSDGH
ncbi:MAG: hypothetical protein IRZ07_29855 [Microbispora sp.]|nr:hypothetical protein [Microbispora sp.]